MANKPSQLIYISTIECVPKIALALETLLPQIADQGSQRVDGYAIATVTVDNTKAELGLIDSAWTVLDSATNHLLRNWPADVFLFMYPAKDSDGLSIAKGVYMAYCEMFPTDQWAYALVAVGPKHKSAKDAKEWSTKNGGLFFEIDEDDLGGFRLFVIEVVRAARRLPPQKPSEDELWAKFAKLMGKKKTDGTAGPSFGSARDPGCNVM